MKQYFSIVVPVVLAALFAPLAAFAQAYPTKPVRVIVVFPPGGSNDVTARIVFAKLPAIMGQQFIIDNRGGASGTIGAAVVAKSPPDGYTVMVQSTTHIANAYAYKGKLQYDTLGDFIGVTPLARQVGISVIRRCWCRRRSYRAGKNAPMRLITVLPVWLAAPQHGANGPWTHQDDARGSVSL
jgi:tripartite-type tricarboxylate transporter receptor subunit TctC